MAIKPTRDVSIDALRGIAVFFMVGSHVVWLTTNDLNPFWHVIRILADSICFIIFLFVSGVGNAVSISAKEYSDEQVIKGRMRLLTLVGVYYIIAYASVIYECITQGFDGLKFLETLLFIYVPGFTEFMLPFIIWGLLMIPIQKYKVLEELFKTRKRVLYTFLFTIIVSMLAFRLSEFMFTISLPRYVNAYLSLFLYTGTGLRFSILNYCGIYIAGLFLGYILKKHKEKPGVITKSIYRVIIGLVFIDFLLLPFNLCTDWKFLTIYDRWPPTGPFLIYGIIAALFLFGLARTKLFFHCSRLFAFLGRSSLGIVAVHIIVLRIIQLLIASSFNIGIYSFAQTDDFLVITIYFIIALTTFLLISKLHLPVFLRRHF